jgi:hypothetical protein
MFPSPAIPNARKHNLSEKAYFNKAGAVDSHRRENLKPFVALTGWAV